MTQAAASPAISEPLIRTVAVKEAYNGKDARLCYAYWPPQGILKDTVVAVHGLSRQKRDFDYLARFLAARGYAFYAVDAPGRGGSEFLPQEDYSLLNFASIFSAFLKQMDLPRVHWVGTSMGGLLAMVMSMTEQAGAFKTLTLVDITHKPNRAALDRIAGYMTEHMPVFTSLAQYGSFLRQNLPLGDVPESIWAHYAEHQLKKVAGGFTFHFDPKIVAPSIVALKADIDLAEGIKKLSCPVALVAGGISDLCTQKEIDDLHALCPALKLHVVPKAGHVPALCDDASQQFIFEHLSVA